MTNVLLKNANNCPVHNIISTNMIINDCGKDIDKAQALLDVWLFVISTFKRLLQSTYSCKIYIVNEKLLL